MFNISFNINFSIVDAIFCINILLAMSVIFFERKNPSATWAWIMIMLFVPVVGFILYIVIGQDMRKRKTFTKKEEEDRYLALLHAQETRLSYHLSEFKDTITKTFQSVIRLHLVGHESLYTDDNHVTIYTTGKDKFDHMFQCIENARKYIHLEYYIIRPDKLGDRLKSLLIKKAKEGVQVLLVYDEMGCFRTKKSYFKELKAAGVKIACFYPSVIPFLKLRLNYRNHRKICVVDGETAFLGGFNIGMEYLGKNKRLGYWRDTHLQITGAAVTMINLQFLLDWRFASKENISLTQYINNDMEPTHSQTGIQIVPSGPDSSHSSILNGYIKMINEAKNSIYIQTPYFIPDDGLLAALKVAALSGIDVHIMIPNKPDHPFVYWATYSYIGELVRYGVKCYTYEKGFLHAKTIVIDEKICSVGTANFDIRSFKLNFEINAFIYDEKVAHDLTLAFKEDLKDCKEVTSEIYENRGYLIRFKESISRLISPIL